MITGINLISSSLDPQRKIKRILQIPQIDQQFIKQMGSFITSIRKALEGFGTKESRIVLIGLDGAGKTTMLYQIKLGQAPSTVPTVGFNVQKVKFKNIQFTLWDIGGQTTLRKLWHHYFDNTNGIIYMVDSSDNERHDLDRDTLHAMLSDDKLSGCPLLIFANKMDLSSISTRQLVLKLGLDKVRGREWHLQPSCALNGQGLTEGFQWLGKMVNKQK